MVTISGQYDPDPARHDAYDFYARKYQETYPQLRELMRAMSGHVAG
jgi:sugar (pentulose or hexulose) kinase